MTAAYLAIRAADVLPDEPRLWFLDHAGAAEAACAIELPLTLVPALSTTRWAVVAYPADVERVAELRKAAEKAVAIESQPNLEKLDTRQRAVYLLRMDGLSTAQIAKRLGLTRTTLHYTLTDAVAIMGGPARFPRAGFDRHALDAVTPRQRAALNLFASGLRVTEVASQLGISYETVKTLLTEGRARARAVNRARAADKSAKRVRPAEKLAPTKSMEIRGHADNDGARRLRLWLAERNLTPETMAVQIGLDDPRPLVLAARGAAAPTTVLLYALRSVCGIDPAAWSTPC